MRIQTNQLKIWVQIYLLNWNPNTNSITLDNNFKSNNWCTACQSIFFSRFKAIVIKFLFSMVPITKIVSAKHKQKITAVLIINSCCCKIPAHINAVNNPTVLIMPTIVSIEIKLATLVFFNGKFKYSCFSWCLINLHSSKFMIILILVD